MLIVVAVVPAMAQLSGQLTVQIPFRFIAGDTMLPEGKYVLEHPEADAAGAVLMRSPDGEIGVLLLGRLEPVAVPAAQDKVMFHTAKDRHFLSRIVVEGAGFAVVLPEGHKEQQLRASGGKLGETPLTPHRK
ncbi:MAG: hypothetical protein PVF68_16860 [Acidobacteriota bacterium]|jgi:hypothetical protein